MPVVVDAEANTFLAIRMQRFGAISGTIADENDVGLPEHDVVAYRADTRPPIVAGKAVTDDRGMYRIWGLEPGSYVIRTLAKHYDDGGYLPTFSRETARLEQARPVEVNMDQESTDANVRPFPGRLYTVSGVVPMQIRPQPVVNVWLVSDMGTETATADSSGAFQFKPQPPGSYELFAQASADRRTGGPSAAYLPILVDRDRTDYRINLGPLPELQISFEDKRGQPVSLDKVGIVARRKSMAGDNPPENLRLSAQGRAQLAPGRWDFAMASRSDYYAAGFSVSPSQEADRSRPDGWNEIMLQGSTAIKFVLSTTPAAVHGTVTNSNREPAAGAPVYLEGYDTQSRRRVLDLRMTRTDLRGQYQFTGLAPGVYRVLATFEYQMPGAAAMESARPTSVTLEEGRDSPLDLVLYVAQ